MQNNVFLNHHFKNYLLPHRFMFDLRTRVPNHVWEGSKTISLGVKAMD